MPRAQSSQNINFNFGGRLYLCPQKRKSHQDFCTAIYKRNMEYFQAADNVTNHIPRRTIPTPAPPRGDPGLMFSPDIVDFHIILGAG